MALAAISRGPIFVFTGKSTWVNVPISAVSFDGATIEIDSAFPDADDANVKAWLAYLAAVGSIWAGAAPSPPPVVPAIAITAAARGSTGNGVRVEIAYPAPSGQSYAVTATKTDTFTGLTLGTARQALDNKRGLVVIESTAGNDKLPADLPATAVGPGGKLTLLDELSKPVFVLATQGATADDLRVTVAVTRGPEPGTFGLVAQWTKQVTVDGSASADAQLDALKGLAYVAAFAAPAGAALGRPQAGAFQLSGGEDATRATATLIAR